MGIKNLNKFIKKHFPEVIKTKPLKVIKDQRISIDTSIFMWKYKLHSGGINWLQYFFNLIQLLRTNNIHPVFCFDGKAPAEKLDTQNERVESRIKSRERISHIENEYTNYLKTKQISDDLEAFCKRNNILLENNVINEDKFYEKITSMKQNLDVKICKEDFELLKEFLNDMKVPYITANGEAEMLCSDLCKNNKVDYVLSSDSDILAYGCPQSIFNINSQSQLIDIINYEELLEKMELNKDEFLDLCIMFGTDYNKNIFKVGPETSFNLIKKHRNIDNIIEHDISILNHKKVRDLFNNHPIHTENIPYCDIPDFSVLNSKYNIQLPFNIEKKFKTTINFI